MDSVTIITYLCALRFRKYIPVIIIAGIVIICILFVFKIDYSTYNSSASLLTVLLGPATIALGYPLSQNLKTLTKNKRAIYFGLIFATTIAILLTYITGKLLHTEINIICSLIPKSVTTPIAVEISKTIGGDSGTHCLRSGSNRNLGCCNRTQNPKTNRHKKWYFNRAFNWCCKPRNGNLKLYRKTKTSTNDHKYTRSYHSRNTYGNFGAQFCLKYCNTMFSKSKFFHLEIYIWQGEISCHYL